MKEITSLRNLGIRSQQRLAAAGITSPTDLQRLGAVETYRRFCQARPEQAHRVFLWALEGALLDVHWAHLPPQVLNHLNTAADQIHQELGITPRASAPTASKQSRH